MKKLLIFLAACIVIVAAFFLSSAFTMDKEKKQGNYMHFEYRGAGYSEADYETVGNWISVGGDAPGTNPCIAGTNHICVLRVDQTQLSTNPLLTLPEKLALFLQDQPSASDYVNANYVYQKQ